MQLFKHFSEEERFAVLKDLCAVTKHYQKGETVLHAGSENRYIFTVLSGSVKIQNNDIWGNTSVLNMVEKGQVFAEAYAFLPGEKLLVEAVANEPCEVLLIDTRRIFALPESEAKNKLNQNLLFISPSLPFCLYSAVHERPHLPIRSDVPRSHSLALSVLKFFCLVVAKVSDHATFQFED